VLRDVRRLLVPELDAVHEQIEVRTPGLRLGVHRGRNVASDYSLVERAAPFLHHLRRPQVTVVLEGHARFEEADRREWVAAGALRISDPARAGTDAFAGRVSTTMVVEWDPATAGSPYVGDGTVVIVGGRDCRRLDAASQRLAGPGAARAAADIVDLLRSVGVPLERIRERDLERDRLPADLERLHDSFCERLSRLEQHPAVVEVAGDVGTSVRQVHRLLAGVARRYAMPWGHWRSALHYARMLQAIRLLAAPGATTEIVARWTGFRAPAALCHAFDAGGLPSPGTLAQAARRDPLDAWASLRREPRAA
jgi:hypothetical protein